MSRPIPGSMVRVRRTKHKRHTKIEPSEHYKAGEHRAHYALTVIEDQPWLDGKYTKLSKVVQDHYKCCRRMADEAVTRAYQLLKIEHDRMRPEIAYYLIRVHQKTIELGMRKDPKIITAAAAELRKIVGVGEPDQIRVTGETSISLYDKSLLAALNLTNAQRLAEIDRMEKEKADETAVETPATDPAPVESEPDEDLMPIQSDDDEDENSDN